MPVVIVVVVVIIIIINNIIGDSDCRLEMYLHLTFVKKKTPRIRRHPSSCTALHTRTQRTHLITFVRDMEEVQINTVDAFASAMPHKHTFIRIHIQSIRRTIFLIQAIWRQSIYALSTMTLLTFQHTEVKCIHPFNANKWLKCCMFRVSRRYRAHCERIARELYTHQLQINPFSHPLLLHRSHNT